MSSFSFRNLSICWSKTTPDTEKGSFAGTLSNPARLKNIMQSDVILGFGISAELEKDRCKGVEMRDLNDMERFT